jgi:hypothetical protein
MSEKELPPVIALRVLKHAKGTPYPEMQFDQEAVKYGRVYTSYACFSNEDIKLRLDEQYTKNPKAVEGTIFYYEMYKEPTKKEEV